MIIIPVSLYQLKCCRDSFCHALIPYIVSRGASRLPPLPLLPFLAPALDVQQQFYLSACFAGVMFFSIGMLKSLVFEKPVFISGLHTLLTGGTANIACFLYWVFVTRNFWYWGHLKIL